MALPNAMESFPTLAHPLANKVGWFNLNNIACGLLGMPLGFLVIYVVSLMGKEPSKEMQALSTRSASRVAERCSRKRPPDDREAATNEESGAFGPRFFMGGAAYDSLACHRLLEPNPPVDSRSLITYWYFHLPNFVLAAVMYTLLGASLARAVRGCRTRQITFGDFSAASPIRWSPRLRWSRRKPLRPSSSGCSASSGCSGFEWSAVRIPAAGRRSPNRLKHVMNRNAYYIAIAFFGMINGIFNQTALLFALIHMQVLAPSLLFGSTSLTLMFSSLMVSTATIILAGIPAAIYERPIGAKDDSTDSFAVDLACGHCNPDAAGDRKFLPVRAMTLGFEPELRRW